MSAAGVRTPRLPAPRSPEEPVSLLERLRLWLPGWKARRDPLMSLAIDDEIENHILERTELLMEQGMSARAARREAERRFGNVRRVRHTLHRIGDDQGGDGGRDLFGSLLRDLKHGVRTALDAPGFAVAVILTIGLGVGANTALFSVTDAVLLRPLPYERPDELVSVSVYSEESDGVIPWASPDLFKVWRESIADITDLIGYARRSLVRTDGSEARQIYAHAVSVDWLGTLDIAPAKGRSFTADDAAAGAAPVVIISDELWRTDFNGDPDVLGATIELDRQPYTVIGVMQDGFRFPPLLSNDVWMPLTPVIAAATGSSLRVELTARLPEGPARQQVQARLDASLPALEEQGVAFEGSSSALIRPLDSFRANPDVRRALWVLTGAVGIMLLIAAVNAANLLLLRATTRAPEDAVRLALGASRGRLVRQHLTENLLLVAAGGVVALALARGVLGAIVRLLPREITSFLTGPVTLDARVLVFTLAVTAIAGVFLSLVPALRATRSAQPQLAGARTSAAPGTSLLRNALVVAEVTLTVILLVGAGLMINSFLRLTSVDPGYEPEDLLQLSLSLPPTTYPDGPSQVRFSRELADRVRTIPGVARVALSNGSPPGAGALYFGMTPQAEGHDPKPYPGDFMNIIRVDEAFFRTMGSVLVSGRDFTTTDGSESGNIIVDRDTARFFWGDEDPVGRRLKLDSDEPDDPWVTVIGVVNDFKLWGLDDRQGSLDLFYPLSDQSGRSYVVLTARTDVRPEDLFAQVRAAVRDLDPELPIYDLTTGARSLAASVDKPRFFLRMMVIFAALALGLAVIGTYGVLAFTVRRRHRELGVRIALGAHAGKLQAMVLRQGLRLAAVGVVLGTAAALALGRLAQALLFEVEPTDPLTFALVAVVMLFCAALACWVPARRATHVDPVEVLRAE
ncbi:MAG: ABC transporter permease [Acidobacteriota bacterium]|jgi:predicted permease